MNVSNKHNRSNSNILIIADALVNSTQSRRLDYISRHSGLCAAYHPNKINLPQLFSPKHRVSICQLKELIGTTSSMVDENKILLNNVAPSRKPGVEPFKHVFRS